VSAGQARVSAPILHYRCSCEDVSSLHAITTFGSLIPVRTSRDTPGDPRMLIPPKARMNDDAGLDVRCRQGSSGPSPVGHSHPPGISPIFLHPPRIFHPPTSSSAHTFHTMSEAKVNPACARCTRIHQHCDRKNPCGGCARLGLDCVPRTAKVPCPTCGKMMSSRRKTAIRHTKTDGSEGQIGIYASKETDRDDVKDVVNKLGRFARDPSFVRSLDDDQLQQMFRTWEAIIRKSINCEQATGKPT
jgi:hypothetical protein